MHAMDEAGGGAYSYALPQVHRAPGVPDHVDVPLPKLSCPGAPAALAGLRGGAGLGSHARHPGQAVGPKVHPSSCVGCAAGHGEHS